MENFIEKLKTVDKKVWIGVGIGVAVLVIVIVALVIGFGNNKPVNGDTQGTQYGTETEGGVTEVFGTEEVTEVFGTEMATETEMGTETEMATETEMTETELQVGQTVTNADGTTTTKNENGTLTITTTETGQLDKTVKEDGDVVIGVGTVDNPILEIPDLETMTLKTVSVPAGGTVYYGIQRVGGKYLTIEDADAYVVDSENKKHNSKGGEVYFKLENALASDFVMLQIGNNGSTAKTFTLHFADARGTWNSPHRVSNLGPHTIELAAGNDVGYYYTYTATQEGTIRFYVSGSNCGLSVTNERNCVNRTFECEDDVKQDESGNKYLELQVKAGDVIKILASAVPNKDGSYPATTVTWHGSY